MLSKRNPRLNKERTLESLLDVIQNCDQKVLPILKEKGITAITIVSTKEKMTGAKRESMKLSSIGLKKEIEFLYSRNKDEIVLCVDELLDTENIKDDIKADPKKLRGHYERCLASIIHSLIR